MATLYITEFSNIGFAGGAASQVAAQPHNVKQTVAIGGVSAQSSAFAANTSLIRLHTDAICSVQFGTNPTATATDARMAANQTEYFTVPMTGTHKVAVITNT